METQDQARQRKNAKEKESVCQLCDKIYNQEDESPEIAESGEFICPNCWNE